jgi:hypothetical protein
LLPKWERWWSLTHTKNTQFMWVNSIKLQLMESVSDPAHELSTQSSIYKMGRKTNSDLVGTSELFYYNNSSNY